MAWTTPRTWVAGEVLTAALLNVHVRDNELALSTHVHSGAAGDGGTSLGPLVLADFTTAAAPAAPGAGKGRLYAGTGDRPGWRGGTGAAEVLVTETATQTLSNKTLTTPTIASFVNAQHGHADPASGGLLTPWDYDSASNTEIAVWLDFENMATLSSQLTAISSGTGGGGPSMTRDSTTGKAGVTMTTHGDTAGGRIGFRIGPTGAAGPVRAANNPKFKVITSESAAGTRTVERTYLGFRANQNTGLQDGIYFRSTDSGNWLLVCRSGGVETTVDMGVSQDSTRRMLEFRVTGGGTSVQGYINGTATGPAITTNIPTGYLEVLVMSNQESAGGSAPYHAFAVWGIGFKTGWA